MAGDGVHFPGEGFMVLVLDGFDVFDFVGD
jgi:hypothetical protein